MPKPSRRHRRRDIHHSIASTLPDRDLEQLVRVLPDLPINSPVVRSPYTEVEDYRLFTPDAVRVSKSSRRRSVRIQLAPASAGRTSGRPFSDVQALMFRAPKFALVCVRRKQRKEVLFASGKGGKRTRRGRRSFWSDVRC